MKLYDGLSLSSLEKSQQQNKLPPLEKAGGLWEKVKGDTVSMLSGKTEISIPKGSRIFIFKNSYKTSDRHPSHVIRVAISPEENTSVPESCPF